MEGVAKNLVVFIDIYDMKVLYHNFIMSMFCLILFINQELLYSELLSKIHDNRF